MSDDTGKPTVLRELDHPDVEAMEFWEDGEVVGVGLGKTPEERRRNAWRNWQASKRDGR